MTWIEGARGVLFDVDGIVLDAGPYVAAGCKTALMLTGGTTRDGLGRSGFRPDRVCDSVADLFQGA